MNFLSGRGTEEPTVYGWNTKVSAPFMLHASCCDFFFHFKLKDSIIIHLISEDIELGDISSSHYLPTPITHISIIPLI